MGSPPLVTPPLATYKHFVHHYVDAHYGHLRQGARLFVSSCDFLQLDQTYPFWRNALIAAGMSHIIPNANPRNDLADTPIPQPLAAEELKKATIPHSPSDVSDRRISVRPSWTLLEVLMEPLFYNCNYNGNAGGRICDSRRDGKNWMYHTRVKTMAQCQLHRVSPARRIQADQYYAYTKAMALAGLTHTLHLLTGFDPGETLRWLEHSDLVARCTSRQIPVPCTADHLTSLRSCMPTQWISLLDAAIRAKQPHHDTTTLLNAMPPPPDAWYRHQDFAGHPDTQSTPPYVQLTHHVSPTGVITSRRTSPSSVPLSSCSQIHVWLQRRPLTSQAATDARDRALARGEPDPFPPTILTSGAVANPTVLPVSPFPHGANPSHFSLTYPPTDRIRQPTPLHEANVNHLYFSQVAHLFRPIRTLDPDHRPTTQTSASYTHLLSHPTEPPVKIRQAIIDAPMNAKLPPRFRETQFHVRCDDHHIGDRCVKKGTRKGVCDLCLVLLNRRTPETLRHILLECPFSQPVVTTVWRSIFLKRTQPGIHAATAHLSTADFIARFERRILFGVAQFDGCDSPEPNLEAPTAALAAVTNDYLIRRRHHNAHNTAFALAHDTPRATADIYASLAATATAMRSSAEAEENMIYTHYEGWLPEEEELPTTKWRARWCGDHTDCPRIFNPHRPSVTLKEPLPTNPPRDAAPPPAFDPAAPDVLARQQQRHLNPRN